MKTSPVHKENFPLYNFHWLFRLVVFCLYWFRPTFHLQVEGGRQFFQMPKFNQTVSLVLRNLSMVFVCELIELASVNFSFDTIWISCILLRSQEESYNGVVSSMLKRIFAHEEHMESTAQKWLAICIICCVLGVERPLVHRFWKIWEINIHQEGRIDCSTFIIVFVCSNI